MSGAWPFFGYAPGNYHSLCAIGCKEPFEGDKRALRCLDCAIKTAKDHIAKLEEHAAATEAASAPAAQVGEPTEAMIEAGARALCRVTGLDPDALGVDRNPRWKGWAQYAEPAYRAMVAASPPVEDMARDDLLKLEADLEERLLLVTAALTGKGRAVEIHASGPSPLSAKTGTEGLKDYARQASIALMAISGGGSEMFKRIGEEYYAEPDLCLARYREKMETRERLSRPARANKAAAEPK